MKRIQNLNRQDSNSLCYKPRQNRNHLKKIILSKIGVNPKAPINRKIASKTLGKLGVSDAFFNFKAFRRGVVSAFNLRGGETFGAEFLVIAKKRGLAIGEIKYDPSSRRRNPQIGGTVKANLRII